MKLVLGTAQFGLDYGVANQSGQISLNQAHKILELARTCGVRDLDTAINYGDAEHRLGQIGVKDFRVITKLPPQTDQMLDADFDTDAWVKKELIASLKRLNLKSLYGVLIHKPADLFGRNGQAILKSLEQCKTEGLVQKLGVSVYDPTALSDLMHIKRWDIVQAPLSIMDRRLVTSGWLRHLNNFGVEVHARSVFMQGLILKNSHDLPIRFTKWSHIWNEWDDWQSATGYSALEASLAYVKSFPEVDRILVGIDGLSHLREILAALSTSVRTNWPEIACDDDQLVNPFRWNEL